MDSNLNSQDELADILNSSNDNNKSLNGREGDLDEELKRMENELEDESGNVDNDISYINNHESIKQLNVNNKEEGIDVYKESIEDKYHNIKKFKCVSVIKEEKELCLKIINYKNKRKEEFNCWKIKKELLDNQETFMLNLIETEQLSLNDYKSMIKNTLDIEQKHLKEIVNDKSLSSIEIEETKRRITNRINLINKELSEDVDEDNENENETNQQEQQQQKDQKEQQQQQQTIQSNNNNIKENKENKTKENNNNSNNINNDTNDNINTSNDITPPPKLTIDDLKLIVNLETLFDEYKSAFIYFKSHNLPDLKHDANSKAKLIYKGITAIETGQGKTFSLKDFPPRITPSYICGCSSQEKQSQFTKLLNLIASELRKYESSSNTMNPEQLYPKLKKQINSKPQQTQIEYTKLKQLQSLITKAKDDEWTRCPEYDYIEYKEMFEKVNESIAENCVVIRLSNLTYEYENLFIEVSCNEFENVKKCRIDPVDDKNKTYNMDVVWFMSSKEFKNLFRKKIEVKLYSSGYFFNSLRGEFQYKLHSLKSITSIRERIPIEIKNEMFYMNIQIDIRKSCVEPEMVERTYNKFAITKVYPRFEFIIEDIFTK
jgi:hypothetical protein